MGKQASALGYLLLIVGIRYFCFVKKQDLTPITSWTFWLKRLPTW